MYIIILNCFGYQQFIKHTHIELGIVTSKRDKHIIYSHEKLCY